MTLERFQVPIYKEGEMKLRLYTSGKFYQCARCNKLIFPRDKYTIYDHAKLCHKCYSYIKEVEYEDSI